jgi:hypothetical protein
MESLHFNYIKSLSVSRFFRAFVTGAALLCNSSWAALGGNSDTVQQDQLAMSASGSAKPIAGATLHTQVLPGGLTVRQYVDPAGLVFAVGWEGPVQPDFERLLGAHFSAYQGALQQQRRGVVLRNADLVLESGGMMRSFVGRAYLPAKVPAALGNQAIR